MSIDSIHSTLPQQIDQIMPNRIRAADQKGLPPNPLLHLSMSQATAVRQQPGVVRDLQCLTRLKAQIQRTRQGRGPKRQRRLRRRRLQRRFRMVQKRLMNRLHRHFNRHRRHGCHGHHGHHGHHRVPGGSPAQAQGTSTSSGGDFSFLDDPNLSMSDKIEMFLAQCAKQTEAKMQELMKQYDDQGQSGSKKSDTKHKVVGALTKIGAAVASVYGGPAAGAAVNTAGNAINNATDSKKGDSETDQRMTMFKIQKLQSQLDEMFQLFSKISNSDDETKKRIIANC